MRHKVHGSRKAKTHGVSFLPEQIKYAKKRSFDANITVSRYIHALIELDQRKNLLPEALTAALNDAGFEKVKAA